MSSTRIILYTQDANGLNHTSRALHIARHLSKKLNDCSLLLLTDLAIVGKFKLPENVDYVHLPGIVRTGNGTFRSQNLNVELKKSIRIRCKIAQSTAKTFKPQIVLVDRDPTQIPKESFRTLSFIRQVLPKTRIIWGLKDILGCPDEIKKLWQKKKVYRLLHHCADELWIYGAKDIFDPVNRYDFPNTLRSRVTYTGYFDYKQVAVQERPKDLDRFDQNKPLVLVTAGSGVEAGGLVDSFLRMFEQRGPVLPFVGLVVTGPMMSRQIKKDFLARAAGLPGLMMHRFSKHILQYMHYAELVFSVGGYNTLNEIMSLRKRAIFVPGKRSPFENLSRAQRFAELGFATMINADELSPGVLERTIREALLHNSQKNGASPSVNLPVDGLDRIVERIRAIAGLEDKHLKIAS